MVTGDAFVTDLQTTFGDRVVLTGAAIADRPAWQGNGLPDSAPALLRPRTTAELSSLLRACHGAGRPVVPQGGLTGLVRGTVTDAGVLALSLDRMNEIEQIDAVNCTMHVQAGVPLQVVQERAEQEGLMFPLDLGARGSATIGGNIATNAGGNRVVRYGMMRDNVLGLEAVLADGTVVDSMHPLIKNNTGYDLKQLFIGSEGTLGVVTRAILRLRPSPGSQNVAFVAVSDFARVPRLLRLLDAELGGSLSAFEVLWRNYYELVTSPPATHQRPVPAEWPYFVLVEALGGAPEQDAPRFEAALATALEDGIIADAVIASNQSERDALWAMRDDVGQNARHAPIQAFDVSLPLDHMESYVTAVNAALQRRWPAATNMTFGHLGDGNIHLIIGVGDGTPAAHHAVSDIVYAQLRPFGGSISAEHGIGTEKKPWLEYSRNDTELALMRTLKQAFDPSGILNPGKVL